MDGYKERQTGQSAPGAERRAEHAPVPDKDVQVPAIDLHVRVGYCDMRRQALYQMSHIGPPPDHPRTTLGSASTGCPSVSLYPTTVTALGPLCRRSLPTPPLIYTDSSIADKEQWVYVIKLCVSGATRGSAAQATHLPKSLWGASGHFGRSYLRGTRYSAILWIRDPYVAMNVAGTSVRPEWRFHFSWRLSIPDARPVAPKARKRRFSVERNQMSRYARRREPFPVDSASTSSPVNSANFSLVSHYDRLLHSPCSLLCSRIASRTFSVC